MNVFHMQHSAVAFCLQSWKKKQQQQHFSCSFLSGNWIFLFDRFTWYQFYWGNWPTFSVCWCYYIKAIVYQSWIYPNDKLSVYFIEIDKPTYARHIYCFIEGLYFDDQCLPVTNTTQCNQKIIPNQPYFSLHGIYWIISTQKKNDNKSNETTDDKERLHQQQQNTINRKVHIPIALHAFIVIRCVFGIKLSLVPLERCHTSSCFTYSTIAIAIAITTHI